MSANKPQIVMFLGRDEYTGGQRYLRELFRYFQKRGIKTEPIYVEAGPRMANRLGLVFDCIKSNLDFFRQASQISGINDAVFFEDFYLHPRLFIFNALMQLLTGQLRTVSLVQNLPAMHPVLTTWIYREMDKIIVRIFIRQIKLFLTNSVFTKQEIERFGAKPSKVAVVYAGYNGGVFRQHFQNRLHSTKKNNAQHILFVGQLTSYKGVEYLLHAFSLLLKGQHRGIVLDIVGNVRAQPDYYQRLVKIVNQSGLRDQVVFHGHVNDPAKLCQLYESATMLVLPSLAEGFGIVLLEAMSAHLPIVATRVSGIQELVKDGENGILVPPKDPVALAAAIDDLLSFPSRQQQYGENGFQFVQAHQEFYSWENVGERVVQAIEPFLAGNRGGVTY